MLQSNIKPYPKFLKIFPFIKNFGGSAIYPNIYLKEDVYRDLLNKNPKSHSMAILKHEQFHIKRQKEIGLLMFGIKYIFIKSFRFNEELLAYKETIKILKKHNGTFDIDRIAKLLSGSMYLWSTSNFKAKSELEKVWNNTA